jgi:hypothetical protein
VRTRIQFRTCRSGATSGSGKEGWFLRLCNLEVTACSSVSRLDLEASRVRRMSAPEKRLKTSSADSGNSQNYSAPSQCSFHSFDIVWVQDESEAMTYAGPVRVVGCNVLLLREPEDPLLEDEL